MTVNSVTSNRNKEELVMTWAANMHQTLYELAPYVGAVAGLGVMATLTWLFPR